VEPAGLLDRADELGVLHGCAAEVAATDRGRVVLARADHHVSAILRKLEVQTRGQAPAAAGRLGLITRPG
jgi:hypothetical protein